MYLHCCVLVVVAAAVVQAASLDKRSDCICQSIESPVCGKDGRDYASRCNAICAGTDEATPGYCLRVEHPIHIPTLRRLSRTSPIWCNCRATAPVCGTKGNTYGNSACAECFGEEVAHTGECPKKENGVQLPENVPAQLPADIFRRELEAVLLPELSPELYDKDKTAEQLPAGIDRRNSHADRQAPCACVMSYIPVCGKDGRTYDNADCARNCGGVEIAHKGECQDQEDGVQLPADIFRRELEAVLLPELSPELYDKDKTAEQLPAGIDRRNSHAHRQAPCACVRSYIPVCGNDGRTYDNADCARNCGGVEIAHTGECQEDGADIFRRELEAVLLPELSPEQAPCACVRSYIPVCGNDGQTHVNSDCARNCGRNVFVWRLGKCEDTCSLLACSKDNKEICRGGVRYPNKCYWNCLNVSESTRIEVPSDKRC